MSTAELRARATLDAAVRPSRSIDASHTEPRRVLLTGATGFLGMFLLSELIARHGHHVSCLVRATDPVAAQRRLQRVADRLGIDWDAIAERVTALAGDISQPRFGLTADHYDRLGSEIGAVYHCAASVNWIHPYCALEASTVGGARNVLDFAVHGATKTVQYVSSLAVFPFNGTIMREAHNLNYDGGLLGGYAQTKWVAEQLMSEAASRGVPVVIYRPPLISGHARTGVFNRSSYFENMVKGCVEMKQVPRVAGMVDVAPVDYVASALAHISHRADAVGRVFHLNNPQPLEFHLLTDWIRARGHRLASVTFDEWRRNLLGSPGHKRNALYPFTPHLRAASAGDMNIPAHDCGTAQEWLAGSGVVCPPVADPLLSLYFDFFEMTGFLYSQGGLSALPRARRRTRSAPEAPQRLAQRAPAIGSGA